MPPSGLDEEVATIVLAIVVGLFTVVGGIGGAIYVAYFSCAIIMSIVMVYFADVFYDPLNRSDNMYGSIDSIYDVVVCGRTNEYNDENSLMTFLSRDGMLEGIIIILSMYTSFCHYWAAVMSRGWAKASACRLQVRLS